MALDEQMQEAPDQNSLSDDEENDLKIAVLLAQNLLDEGGIDVIDNAIDNSNDPGQVVGQFLMQMGSQLAEKMPQDMQISPKIFFAHGGWVEQVSDYLQEEYNIPRKIMDRAEIYIATAAQKMSQGQQQQAAAGQPPQAQAPAEAAPTIPQGGM